MFRKIEFLYKKESEFNKIVRTSFAICFLIFIPLWIFGIFDIFWAPILNTLILLIIMYFVILKLMKVKLTINKKKLKQNIQIAREKINKQEKNIIKNFMIKNDWYNKETVEQVINHYRSLILPKSKVNNFWGIVSVIITLIIAIFDKDNINTNLLVYIILAVVIYVIIYSSYNQLLSVTKLIKGEDGMNERLEEIFCELYSELIYSKEDKKVNKRRK